MRISWSIGYVITIAILYYFYFNQSPPLSEKEIQNSVACNSAASPEFRVCDALLSKKDIGKEFYALNFIKRRTSVKNLYPPDFEVDGNCGESVENAEQCYSDRILPLLFKRFSYPVLLANPLKFPFLLSNGIDIKFEDNFEFDRIAIVRYRSRRDFLSMIEEASALGIKEYKEASVDKTIVYITDVDELPIITVILFTFWCTIVAGLYSVVYFTVSTLCC